MISLSLLIISYLQFTACKDEITSRSVRSYLQSHGSISVHVSVFEQNFQGYKPFSLTLTMFSGFLRWTWWLLHHGSSLPQNVNLSKNCIVPGCITKATYVEMHTQKLLSNYYRSTVLNLRVVREHVIFSCPLLHGYYNGDVKPTK